MKIFSIIFISSMVVLVLVGTCWIPTAAPADELQGLHGGSNGTNVGNDKWGRVWNENVYMEEEVEVEGEEFLMESEVSRRILTEADGIASEATPHPDPYCPNRICGCIGGPKCSKQPCPGQPRCPS